MSPLLFAAAPSELQGRSAVKISQREQERGSTVCVRAQEGSVKSLWQSSIRLTCLPPETTAIKPVVGCQSSVAVFFHKAQAWDLITEGKLDHSLLQETGWQVLYNRSAGTPLWSWRRGLSICVNVFSDIITNSIGKLIKEEEEEGKKGAGTIQRKDFLISPLLLLTSFFGKISKKVIMGNELKNVEFRECS